MNTDVLDRKGLLIFCLLAFSLAWLMLIPVWMDGNLSSLNSIAWMAGMMLTPALAAFFVINYVSPVESKRRSLGMQRGNKGWWKYCLLAWLCTYLICIAAPFVSSLFPWYELDLENFSYFRSLAEESGASIDSVSVNQLVVAQLVAGLLIPVFSNGLFALGEELGWRGYLLPNLLPLGEVNAIILSGVIWGVWHAPAIYLGHNYPDQPIAGIGLMIVFCLIYGTLFSWLRLVTNSVWPCVIAHAMLNGMAAISSVFAASEFDAALAGVTGVTGWIIPVAVIAYLYFSGRLLAFDTNKLL